MVSQTYRVPVLYILLPAEIRKGPHALEFIHRNLVNKSLVPDLEHIGILGGVTMTVGRAICSPSIRD